MKTQFIPIFFFIFGIINSQIINGKIISKENNEPIPYAKIGINNENIGSSADENGNFSIDLTNVSRNNFIIVEYGGYQSFKDKVENFINSKNHTITLQEKIFNIQEVLINPKKYINKNWGTNAKSKKVLFGFNPARSKEDKSKEFGVLFSNSKKIKIDKINLNIVDIKTDLPILLNFNIYSKDDKFPGQSLANKTLSVILNKDKIIDETFTFDISDENIWINKQDFFVTVQAMNGFDGWLYLSGALLKSVYYRNFYGPWTKLTVAGPAINIDVKIEK